ncbi:hypothetical protein Q5M85_11985 [Paraclostridium bifermentans]|nr:hypothetical protein [Paraclostridium bifermentans]
MRQLILVGTDIACIVLSFIISTWIIYSQYYLEHIAMGAILVYVFVGIVTLSLCRCYHSLWRYAGEEELIAIVFACTLSVIITYLIHLFMGIQFSITFTF